jgi:hypothetical protein
VQLTVELVYIECTTLVTRIRDSIALKKWISLHTEILIHAKFHFLLNHYSLNFFLNKFCNLGGSKSRDIIIDAEEITFCDVEFYWMLQFPSFDLVAQFPCMSLFIPDMEISKLCLRHFVTR